VNIEVFQKLKDCRPGASFFLRLFSCHTQGIPQDEQKSNCEYLHLVVVFRLFCSYIRQIFPQKKITRGRTPRVLRAFFAGRLYFADLQKTARLSFYYRRDPVLITPDIRCHTAYLLCLKSSIDGNSEVFNFLL